ncbi:hypothetical protein JYG30_05880 [Fibrella sp. USSR17]
MAINRLLNKPMVHPISDQAKPPLIMDTTSKKFYDYLAGFMFIILMIGMFEYQLVTAWFIAPLFLVLIFTSYKRIQLLEKEKAKSAFIMLAALVAILGLYIFYTY